MTMSKHRHRPLTNRQKEKLISLGFEEELHTDFLTLELRVNRELGKFLLLENGIEISFDKFSELQKHLNHKFKH